MANKIQHTENELLISRFLNNLASDEEKKKVKDLLLTDDQFKEQFIDFQQRSNEINATLFYDSIDEEKALKEIYSKANIKEEGSAKVRHMKPAYTLLKIAAVLIVGVFIAFLVKNREQAVLLCSRESVLTDNLMPDSSRISLNKLSTLQYTNKFGNKNRTLSLSGEAHFSVKKNPQMPFIVDCGDLFVEVTGTSFTVNNYPDREQIKVFVSSGRVKVYNNEQAQVTLNPGEIATYDKKEKTLIKSYVGIESNINSWMTQSLIFNDTPLQQVIADINNYYNVNIKLDVTDMSKCRLSASFEKASLDAVLEMICLSFGLELVEGETITLKGDGC